MRPDLILSLIESLRSQGVLFEFVNGRVHWRAPRGVIKLEQKRLLADHAQIVVAILEPDRSLPDVLTIPAHVSNTTKAITACIDAQRIRKAT